MRATTLLLCSLLIAAPAAAAPAKAKKKIAKKPSIAWDLANLSNPRVEYWIGRFQTDKRAEFTRFLRRKPRYEKMIHAKLRKRGMPRDLIYLAMIESGFNPDALSVAGARGMWQLIPDTARRYGLRVDGKIDERKDPEKSTDAALEYLGDLHDRFDCWYLAAAAYNSGENRIGRIMRAVTGAEAGEDKHYYTIWKRLPDETRDYVPVMIAAARISKEPTKYGFDPSKPEPESAIRDTEATLADLAARLTKPELQEEHEELCSDAKCALKRKGIAREDEAADSSRSLKRQ